jgi:hypothetical protein
LHVALHDGRVRSLAAVILAFVFFDELAVMVAFGVWGASRGGPLSVLLWLVLPVVAMTVWFFFASPKAKYGGPVRRPVVKVLVFGLASAALWHAGHPGWALALLVFSMIINALAQLSFVQRMITDLEAQKAS